MKKVLGVYVMQVEKSTYSSQIPETETNTAFATSTPLGWVDYFEVRLWREVTLPSFGSLFIWQSQSQSLK